MNHLLDLFITFFKIGLVSFGGGYAMIPLIQGEMESHKWININQLTDIVAVSAMAPGPIASNTATIVGYKLDSIIGATIACMGVTLPSFLLILIIGKYFMKFQENSIVKAAFYGLRPTIIGIIAYAAIKFALANNIIGGSSFIDFRSSILMIAALVVLLKNKLHPAYLILASGIVGIVLFR
jgi:chromate transporter